MGLRVTLLVAFAVLTYWNGLSGPFILDDRTAILENHTIESLALPGPLLTPSETPVARRPLVNLSFAVNYALAGREVRSYHVGNLVVHVLAALAFWGVVRRTLLLPPLKPRFEAAATDLGWVSALVWLLHPLNSEVVNYVTQRSESLMGLFYLLTIYAGIRAADRRTPWGTVAVLCCTAGMLCKESMVTAPVSLLVYDRIFLFESWKAVFARRWRLHLGLAASWVILLLLMASAERTTAGFGTEVSPWVYLLNQVRLIPHYLYLSVWPRSLVVDYGTTHALPFSAVLAPGVIMCVLVGGTIALLIQSPRLAFPAAWFFITLAPASSIVPIATEVGAERRMYLPLAGLVALAVVTVYLVTRRASRTGRVRVRIAAGLICALLSVETLLRNREYRDPLTLAQTVVARWPSGRAHAVLGLLLSDRGQSTAAIAELRQAAVLYPLGGYALGVTLVQDGQTEEGLTHLREFIQRKPDDDAVIGARDLIARVLFERGEIAAASREVELLLVAHPDNIRARVLLGHVRMRQQRLAEGVTIYQQARRLDASVDRDPQVMTVLGAALLTLNRRPEALQVLADGAAARPDDPGVQKLWGRALAMSGRFVEAEQHFRQAALLAPRDEEAQQLVDAVERQLRNARADAR